MLGTLDKYLFFIASFSPLWIIMSIRHILDNHDQCYSQIGVVVVFGIVAISIVSTRKKISSLRKSSNAKTITVSKSREITMEYIPYIVSCLFPIFVVIDGIGSFFTVIAAMALVGIFYVKTRMVLTNPAIILIGFKIYEIECEQYTRPIKIISKTLPERDHCIRVRDMDHDLCIEQKD